MISMLKTERKVVGVKQSRKAVEGGLARAVFLAEDADPQVTDPMEETARRHQVPVERVSSMKELGAACGISVGAAVAVLLNG